MQRDGRGTRVNKPIYELPLTDPGAPPFGAPGTAGAMPVQRGELPPDPVMRTDFSHLPPPAAGPGSSPEYGGPVTPAYSAPGYTPAPTMTDFMAAPPPDSSLADFATAPPAAVAPTIS